VVLVVDDNDTTRKILQTLLSSAGLNADCCENGRAALRMAEAGHYETFLIDYRMPEMKGDELAGLLRLSHPKAFIIGFSVESKDLEFRQAGANVFVPKEHLAQNIIPIVRNKSTTLNFMTS